MLSVLLALAACTQSPAESPAVTTAKAGPAPTVPAAAVLAASKPPNTTAALPSDTYPDLSALSSVRVLVLGDSGEKGSFPSVAKAAATVCFPAQGPACHLAVMVGDNVYEDGFLTPAGAEWRDAFATPMAPFVARAKDPVARFRVWVVPGNHDWNQKIDAEGERRIAAAVATVQTPENHAIGDLWQLPALAYEVPGLPSWLHLHGLDSQTLIKGGPTTILDATRAAMQSESGWEVVYSHHFPVSTGGHALPENDGADAVRYASMLQGLRADGLNMLIAGHDHIQEILDTAGMPVAIQGNSSKGREVRGGPYAACSRWSRGGADARGFLIVTFTEADARFEFFDGDGKPLPASTYKRADVDGNPDHGKPLGACTAGPPHP